MTKIYILRYSILCSVLFIWEKNQIIRRMEDWDHFTHIRTRKGIQMTVQTIEKSLCSVQHLIYFMKVMVYEIYKKINLPIYRVTNMYEIIISV